MDVYSPVVPLLRLLDPETAHRLTLRALAWGLGPTRRAAGDPILATRVWGRDFANPIGLAAGFDKDGLAAGPMLALGFGFAEVGSVTPRPQPGNPKPRIFRLPEDRAVINRLGFNSRGADAAARQLARWRARGLAAPLGVNLGKNRDSADAAADYAEGARRLGRFADFLVITVSSPNTPGLRAHPGRAELEALLGRVREALAEAGPGPRPPLVLKIAPDLGAEDLADVAAVALAQGLDGIIATNTTVSRPAALRGRHRDEAGGLSGRPLFDLSTRVLSEVYRLTGGRIPLIGTGGIANGADAYAKIRAGASLVQLYTAVVYDGPALLPRLEAELADLLRRDGFAAVAEAVGADHRTARS